jgi:hypothetical protein
MYDPIWYTEKAITAVAQTIATVSALTLVILYWPKHYSTSAIESTKVVAHV